MKNTINVLIKSFQLFAQGSESVFVIRSKIDNTFFLEFLMHENGTSQWEHGMIYSWEMSGVIPDLTVLTEEEFFQYCCTSEYSCPYKMRSVQKHVLQNVDALLEKRDHRYEYNLQY